MISHLVLMKPRPDLTAAERQTLVAAFERAIREIASVRNVRIGKRVIHGASYEARVADAADYVAMIDFDDLEGLQTYLRHSAHEELGARFSESLSSALVYDFEMGGMEVLAGLAQGESEP